MMQTACSYLSVEVGARVLIGNTVLVLVGLGNLLVLGLMVGSRVGRLVRSRSRFVWSGSRVVRSRGVDRGGVHWAGGGAGSDGSKSKNGKSTEHFASFLARCC